MTEVKGQEINEIEELSIEMLSKASEKFENLKEIFVEMEVGEEMKIFKLNMYKNFSPVSAKECVLEFVRNMDIARKSDRDGFGDIQEPYLMWLMIKHFTTLGEKMPNSFSKQLDSLKHMINTGIFFQIIIHFDENQIEKMKEELESILAMFDNNKGTLEDMKKVALQQIEFKSLLE